MAARIEVDKLAGIAVVIAVHAGALWGLWSHRLIPPPVEAVTLFVNFISPPMPKVAEPAKPPPPKARIEKPPPQQLVAEVPVVAPTEYIVPLPNPAPAIETPSVAVPKPAGPVTLNAELSVSCPERTAPTYPMLSRRMGETGVTVLRVELDEHGHVATAHVANSSGFSRLDEAALAAIKNWRCSPALRNGQAVRAVAMQPFKFILQGT